VTQETEVSTTRLDDGTLVVRMDGSWALEAGIPPAEPVILQISTPPLPACVAFDASELEEWDSSLLAFVRQLGDPAPDGSWTWQPPLPSGLMPGGPPGVTDRSPASAEVR
jgi:hypothetical protein